MKFMFSHLCFRCVLSSKSRGPSVSRAAETRGSALRAVGQGLWLARGVAWGTREAEQRLVSQTRDASCTSSLFCRASLGSGRAELGGFGRNLRPSCWSGQRSGMLATGCQWPIAQTSFPNTPVLLILLCYSRKCMFT